MLPYFRMVVKWCLPLEKFPKPLDKHSDPWFTVAMTNRYHIDVKVPARTDNLLIARYHFNDLGEAQDYQERVAAKNVYAGELSFCKDASCKDSNITAGD